MVNIKLVDQNPGKMLKTTLVKAMLLLIVVGCIGKPNSHLEQAMESYQQGLDFQEVGGISKAEDAYLKAISLNPELAEAYAELGFIDHLRGKDNSAMKYLSQALSINPDLTTAYNYRGIIYYDVGDTTMALLNFTKAIQIDPEFSDAIYNRASTYLYMDDFESAENDMSELITIKSDVPRYFFERAQIRALNGDAAGSKLDLEQVFTLSEDPKLILESKLLLSTIREAED